MWKKIKWLLQLKVSGKFKTVQLCYVTTLRQPVKKITIFMYKSV